MTQMEILAEERAQADARIAYEERDRARAREKAADELAVTLRTKLKAAEEALREAHDFLVAGSGVRERERVAGVVAAALAGVSR